MNMFAQSIYCAKNDKPEDGVVHGKALCHVALISTKKLTFNYTIYFVENLEIHLHH